MKLQFISLPVIALLNMLPAAPVAAQTTCEQDIFQRKCSQHLKTCKATPYALGCGAFVSFCTQDPYQNGCEQFRPQSQPFLPTIQGNLPQLDGFCILDKGTGLCVNKGGKVV